ncbi:MAG: hypothetical protein WD844_13255 [Thermoleophilaceae bacterium]
MQGLRCSLAVVAAGMALTLPTPATAGIEPGDVAWTEVSALPGLSISPDLNNTYYTSVYSASSAHETAIRGSVPNARYWSIAVLDQAGREIANLSDDDIETTGNGSYTVRIRHGCAGRPNCMDVSGAPASALPARMFYRLYVPSDRTGGVPLPEVEYRTLDGVDVRSPVPAGTWTALMLGLLEPLRPGEPAPEALAGPSGLDRPVATPAADPEPRRFDGLGGQQIETLADAGAPAPVVEALTQAKGSAGLNATADNDYLIAQYTFRSGNLVLAAKAPSYRSGGAAVNDLGRADGSEQVRYWSVCTVQNTRPVECLRDERVQVDADGFFRIVVAPACPVAGYSNCLRGGVTPSVNNGNINYRNLLAAGSFANERGPHECPAGVSQFCGDYALQARYVLRG